MMAALLSVTRVKIWFVNKFKFLVFTVCFPPLCILSIESYTTYLLFSFYVNVMHSISSHLIIMWFKLIYCDIASCAWHLHRCYTCPRIRIKLEKFGIYLVMFYITDWIWLIRRLLYMILVTCCEIFDQNDIFLWYSHLVEFHVLFKGTSFVWVYVLFIFLFVYIDLFESSKISLVCLLVT